MPTDFCQRLLTSKLLIPQQLDAARAVVGDDDKDLARHLIQSGLLTPFQVRQIQAGFLNFQLDKYVVLDCLGKSSSSVVFKARHSLMANRLVALKTLDHRDLHKSEEALARFRREIAIVARLEHPNVVRAHDVIRTRKNIYLVLEFLEGRDLSSIVKERGRLPVPEAVEYTVQAARGLAYAHRQGIIHRDVKPANLLLTRENIVKLTDLGLARLSDPGQDAGLTMKGTFLGTLEFTAPEQAEDASRADVRSDLFSLGSTLFHLLTAELPVTGSSEMQRFQRLLLSPPRPLGDARADAPSELARIVDRLRSRDPAHRPGSADEVIALLQPFLQQPEPAPIVWDPAFKADRVLSVLQGQTTIDEACNQHQIPLAELESWRDSFLEGGRRALDPDLLENNDSAELDELHKKIGQQATEIERLKKRLAAAQGRNGARVASS
jgi:serine/threonine protein kinase